MPIKKTEPEIGGLLVLKKTENKSDCGDEEIVELDDGDNDECSVEDRGFSGVSDLGTSSEAGDEFIVLDGRRMASSLRSRPPTPTATVTNGTVGSVPVNMWDPHDNDIRRQYSVPPSTMSTDPVPHHHKTTEDLHAWSIYRQNLNSDFTDSALGTSEKSQRPFGNFQLRESTVQTILNHPKYGPKERASELGTNIQTYLRFGLPRVLPPSGHGPRDHHPHGPGTRTASSAVLLKDTSSGYDSSDDDRRNRRRRVSESEYRGPPVEMDPRSNQRNDRNMSKTNSEADLISADSQNRRWDNGNPAPIPRPNGVIPHSNGHAGRRSVAGSHISASSRQINKLAFPRDAFYSSLQGGGDDEISSIKHPHLQVRDLTYEVDRSNLCQRFCGTARTKLLLLEGLSFEVRGGEMLGIIATSDHEGTTLLDLLGDRIPKKWGSRLRGDFIYNGLFMSPKKLQGSISYVTKDFQLCPDMSVRQWMLFTSLLQESGSPARDTKARINALLEDLGLGQLKHTRISDLTESEMRRLNIAAQLLLDTDIILLDQPIQGMDILDSFFLIDYLRQWAARGRVVILTMQPPTYEIFTMLSRVDLVTLDNLSAEAMLESSQRVENLVELFRRKQESQCTLSDPGPPGVTPAPVRRAGFCGQILALWIRAMIYMFPYNVVHFCRDVLLAALMSVIIGCIFWNVRAGREQEHVLDRYGFYHALTAVCLWPLLLNVITDVWMEKMYVPKDIHDRLYSGFAYITAKLSYNLPIAGAILGSYVFPAYSMAGIPTHEHLLNFLSYLGYILLYLLTLRTIAVAAAWSSGTRHVAAIITSFLGTIFVLTGGYAIHLRDLSVATRFLQYISPLRWTLERLIYHEFSSPRSAIVQYECARNPVVLQENGIQVKADCGVVNDLHARSLYYDTTNLTHIVQSIMIPVGIFLLALIFTIITVSLKRHKLVQRHKLL